MSWSPKLLLPVLVALASTPAWSVPARSAQTPGPTTSFAVHNSPAVAADSPAPAFFISFDSEWIRLSIVGDSLEVRGTYYLTCRPRSGGRVSLFYPFPDDSFLGGARMVSLRTRVAAKDSAAARWQDSGWEKSRGAPGVRWLTPPCTGDTVIMEGVYRQKLATAYARYIVTTTRDWQRPLRLARFEIRLPAGAVPVSFSFPFEAREDSAGRRYTFDAAEFYPDRDIVVRWRMQGTN